MTPLDPIAVKALHLFATVFMTGLIWCVQIVVYPLFSTIGQAFPDYHKRYTQRIGWVVGPVMGLELSTGVLWLYLTANSLALANLLLLGGIWVSTALVQMPLHQRLSEEASPSLVRSLVKTNWLRTALWSLRSCLLFGC